MKKCLTLTEVGTGTFSFYPVPKRSISMNIQNILNTYDNMFGKNTIEEIYDFLKKSIDLSYIEQDYSSSITLLK